MIVSRTWRCICRRWRKLWFGGEIGGGVGYYTAHKCCLYWFYVLGLLINLHGKSSARLKKLGVVGAEEGDHWIIRLDDPNMCQGKLGTHDPPGRDSSVCLSVQLTVPCGKGWQIPSSRVWSESPGARDMYWGSMNSEDVFMNVKR